MIYESQFLRKHTFEAFWLLKLKCTVKISKLTKREVREMKGLKVLILPLLTLKFVKIY